MFFLRLIQCFAKLWPNSRKLNSRLHNVTQLAYQATGQATFKIVCNVWPNRASHISPHSILLLVLVDISRITVYRYTLPY